MNRKHPIITIIGAGVSGLTTAYLLLESGYKVHIISSYHPVSDRAKQIPSFASLYPAASIIPHSVFSSDSIELFKSSVEHFERLYNHDFPGLKQHMHYELFSDNRTTPDYVSLMKQPELAEDFKHHDFWSNAPYPITSGWRYICYFADWEMYFEALFNRVLAMGGAFEQKTLKKEDLHHLPADIIINCSGLGSIDLFEENHSLISVGHLLHINTSVKVMDPSGYPFSYNWVPFRNSGKMHPLIDDIYVYPRKNTLVLGGTRIEEDFGSSDLRKKYVEKRDEFENVNSIASAIFDYNTKVLSQLFEFPEVEFSKTGLRIGYRYLRDKKNGLRIDSEVIGSKHIIHNYGHGGAGVTLSWGCASRVLENLQKA